MRIKLYLIILFSCLILVSCHYPKVLLSKEEKDYIQLKNKQKFIFISDKGVKDTLLIYKNYPFGFEPNFDFWWRKKITKNDTVSTKRDFGKKFNTYANYKSNKSKTQSMNLSVDVLYSKKELDKEMTLSIYPFKEKYNINRDTLEQYVFENNECSEKSSNCVKKIIFELNRGIIYVEKGNGDKWNLVNEL